MGCDMVVLVIVLIDFYLDVGLIDIVIRVYGSLNYKKDVVFYNFFIVVCVKN